MVRTSQYILWRGPDRLLKRGGPDLVGGLDLCVQGHMDIHVFIEGSNATLKSGKSGEILN